MLPGNLASPAPHTPPDINRKEMWMKSVIRPRVAFHRRWKEQVRIRGCSPRKGIEDVARHPVLVRSGPEGALRF